MTASFDGFSQVGLPACIVNHHGRVITWNAAASELFKCPEQQALGREWHQVVNTIAARDCCAFCEARRALHSGRAVLPIEVTVSINGCHEQLTMIPLPAHWGQESTLGFIIFKPGWIAAQTAVRPLPVPNQNRVRQLGEDRLIDELTPRERDVLKCVVDGYDARAIAERVGISHATARNYVQRILGKLSARNKAEAVNVALSYNLLAS